MDKRLRDIIEEQPGVWPLKPRRADWVSIAALAFAIFASLMSALRTYGSDDKATSNRITALEIHQGEADKRMERIENKIDRLLERVK